MLPIRRLGTEEYFPRPKGRSSGFYEAHRGRQ